MFLSQQKLTQYSYNLSIVFSWKRFTFLYSCRKCCISLALVVLGLNTQLTSLSLIQSAAIFATGGHVFPVVLICWKPVHLLSVAGMVHKKLFCRDFETRQ